MISPPAIAIGTCAWSYDDWRGVFYPVHLPPAERLPFHSRHFGTVEVDSTFYHAPSPHVVAHWAEVTPPDFLFSLKLPREITHERRLRDCDELLAAFLAAIAPLRSKLASVLIQLPPSFEPRHDEHTLRDFVRRLPDTVRWTIEFRDPAWHAPRIAHLLQEHRVCWAWNDMSPIEKAAEAPFAFWPHTTDFLYLRLLGDLDTKYGPDGAVLRRYSKLMWSREKALENWAEKIRSMLPAVKRILIYAANHYEGISPVTASRLAAKLGQPIALPTAAELTGEDTRQLDLL